MALMDAPEKETEPFPTEVYEKVSRKCGLMAPWEGQECTVNTNYIKMLGNPSTEYSGLMTFRIDDWFDLLSAK